jgi:hypothetical protein
MTLSFDAAQKTATEQVIRGVTIDDIDTLVVPLDGNEIRTATS